MKPNLSLPILPSASSPAGQPAEVVTGTPRLWPALNPAQRQQLAQCLAELLRRLHRRAATKETNHEPS
jgi:hypothetical protein